MRRLVLLPVTGLAVAALAGCSFAVGLDRAPTVPAEEIAALAAAELQAPGGELPDLDCGEEPVPVEVDGTVDCVVVDPATGLAYDVLLTFESIVDDEYSFRVTRSDLPREPVDATGEPGASVPIEDIEALAVSALAPQFDVLPVVECAGTEIVLEVGTTVSCRVSTEDGESDATVTITSFDGSQYAISID